MPIQCAIVGAKGYTGCELIRILARHPEVTLTFLTQRDEQPEDARIYIPNLPPDKNLTIQKFDYEAIRKSASVVFLALPHTKSIDLVQQFFNDDKIVIDLSADYRLHNSATYETWYKVHHPHAELIKKAVYGLPEVYREKIKKARLIANPGCFPTGILLSLFPLISSGLIQTDKIIIDSKTGVSGAGRNPSVKNHFCEVDGNFQAYKVNQHQHMPEIEQYLSLFAHKPVAITFVPHLLPVQRGILSTLYVERHAHVTVEDIYNAFRTTFNNEPFVRILPPGIFPQLKNVEHSNYCDIGIWADETNSRVIIMSAIDNLVKGASGQAVQNMNIICGLPETMGLV